MEKKVKNFPRLPGVYLFKGGDGEVLYVGKAKSLKDRVSSYFTNRLEAKTMAMVAEAVDVEYILVDSDFEASLLEANIVGEKQPRYNIQLKDGKTPLYIGITAEKYPRIVTLRKTQLETVKLKKVFGPYLNSTTVRRVLKMLRRSFAYSTHRPTKRPCIYSQLGLCKPCPSLVENAEGEAKDKLYKKYKKNVSNVIRSLSGNKKSVITDLLRDMKEASLREDFEEAMDVMRSLQSFEYIMTQSRPTDGYLEDPNLLEDIRAGEMGELKKLIGKYLRLDKLTRIECFDVAHLAGSYPTASMVVFVDGNPDKSLYRHFRIWNRLARSDTDAMREVMRRRKKHFEDWGRPDLIIVDGGKGQVGVAREVIDGVAIVGLAKRFERLVIWHNGEYKTETPKGAALNLVQRLRDEAHRFSRRYHHKLVSKAIVG